MTVCVLCLSSVSNWAWIIGAGQMREASRARYEMAFSSSVEGVETEDNLELHMTGIKMHSQNISSEEMRLLWPSSAPYHCIST